MKSVLIIGATGLVGHQVFLQCLQNPEINEVRIIVRKETGIIHEKLKELVIDFEMMKPLKAFMQCDVLINCMGSTMKKAGSKEKFERYDFYYPYNIATYCKENGTKRMILLSAMGANLKSMFFYNRIKGKLEEACEQLAFEELVIVQPSLLLGNRKESRFGEKLFQKLMPAISRFLPSDTRPIEASQLAQAIVYHAINSLNQKVSRIRYKIFFK